MQDKKFITLPNGETYAYLEQGEDYKSVKETVLLIHGNLSSSLHFMPLFRDLSDLYLVAPDLRGFGDSSYNTRFSSLLELAEDVKLFAAGLGITKARVVGWSTGGGIALELAAKYPEFVSSLFSIQGIGHKGYPLYKKSADGTFIPYANKEELASDSAAIVPLLSALKEKDTSFIENLWNTSIYNKIKPTIEDNKIYITETLKQRNLIDVDWSLINFNVSDEHNGYSQGTGAIKNISCPVTFTCAGFDKVIPSSTIRENAAAIKGSKLIEYKESGHSPLVECPDQLVADIREWGH